MNADAWAGNECAALARPEQRAVVDAWLSVTAPLSTPALVAASPALLARGKGLAVSSRVRLRHNGLLIDVGLEPLAGLLRDPRVVCGSCLDLAVAPNSDIQSHEFIGVDPRSVDELRACASPRAAFLP